MKKANQTRMSRQISLKETVGFTGLVAVLIYTTVIFWSEDAHSFNPGGVINQVNNAVGNAAQGTTATVEKFFGNLKGKTIEDANKIEGWTGDAARAAGKKATDFTACPSPEAQNLYNDLKSKREQATRTQEAALQAEREAQIALGNCKAALPESVCTGSYNQLPYKTYATGAKVAISGLNKAMDLLNAMKCLPQPKLVPLVTNP